MAQQVAAGVWLLDLGFVPPLATNAYLVDDTERFFDESGAGTGVTLVDTGLRWNRRSLRSELAAAGYTLADVDRVLLTHYDLDHTWGLSGIAGEMSSPVYIGAADGRLAAGDDDPPLLHHKGLFHRVARRVAPLPDDVTVEYVEDGDRIGRFTAYHTPGHNPGHTVYVHESGVAFLGDLVWAEHGRLTPPFWLDSYDMRAVRESITSLVERVPPFEVAAMAHGTPITEDGHRELLNLATRL
jgi:glyoxylase-like metal-dependent hydrolase (beta-lactamase superfamily II)